MNQDLTAAENDSAVGAALDRVFRASQRVLIEGIDLILLDRRYAMERLRIAAAAALAVSTLMLCRAVAYEERGESAGDDTEVVDPSAVQPVLPIHDQNGIRYVSGGIGDEEQRALAELAPRFDLKLVFARSDMAYHADVTVRIADEKGREVLLARDVGPYVLVDLPPGHYRVTAENQGEGAGSAKVQTASLSGHGQTKLSFYW